MLQALIELVLSPLLVAASVLVSRRWGHRAGGGVSAFPAIVGPVLLIVALAQGPALAARAASGTLLGLASLAAFALAYARVARRASWLVALAASWAAAVAVAFALVALGRRVEALPALLVAVISIALAYRSLPPSGPPLATPGGDWPRLPLQMGATAGLVAALSAGSRTFGPLVGGILTALPVLASVLAVSAHRQHGPAGAIALLKGMLVGMAGYIAFCEALVLLLSAGETVAAFGIASLAALTVQLPLTVRAPRPATG